MYNNLYEFEEEKRRQRRNNLTNGVKNYFKGKANRPFEAFKNKVYDWAIDKLGINDTLGNLATNAASTIGTETGALTAGAAEGAAAGGSAAAGAASGSTTAGAAAGGPLAIAAAIAAMALTGANRKRAKQSTNTLLDTTNSISEQKANEDLQQTRQSTLEQIPENYPTTKIEFSQSLKNNGWDDNVINSALNGLNLGNKDMSDYINSYNYYGAKDGEQIIIPKSDEEIANAKMLANNANLQKPKIPTLAGQALEETKRSLLDKFISGITDFSRGYNENRNNAFIPDNLRQGQFIDTIQKPNEALINYQNDLRNQGIDENIINAVAQGKNSGNKDIANWINNNKEAFNPIEQTIYTDKSKMARVGEALGTLTRLAQKPGVQGLIAGVLSGALSGNPLYGFGQWYKFGNARQMSDIYNKVLQEQGVNIDPGFFGNVSSGVVDTVMKPQYKEVENNILREKIENDKNYKDALIQNYINKLEFDKDKHKKDYYLEKKYKEGKLNVDRQNAATNAQKVINQSKSEKKSTKVQDNPDWNKDLADYRRIIVNPQYYDKIDEATARMIEKYGVDPMKYLKDF